MAITTTPLGFKKPDGGELVRGGDDIIAANAQKAEDVISPALTRIGNTEAKNATQDGRLSTAETDITSVKGRLNYVEAVVAAGGGGGGTGGGSTLSPDPANPGLYFIV